MANDWLTMDDDSPATWEDWQAEAEAQRDRAEELDAEAQANADRAAAFESLAIDAIAALAAVEDIPFLRGSPIFKSVAPLRVRLAALVVGGTP